MPEYNLWHSFKEACADTGVAFAINVPLNFVLVAFAFRMEMSAFATSVMLTSIFTVFAIVRKTYLRLHFHKKHLKKVAKQNEVA